MINIDNYDLKQTSAEWMSEITDKLLIDPDGWDRKNFGYSFYEELITRDEFMRRLSNSTLEGV